ncbi:LacI family DNA-binding transcriptional regulator [Microbacterium sp. ARD32]|uniref:LacI family DNA-binding transcriptional regulator n=1 Tax=Microbacterium sp. ARD32 TaxID=2962577 RepID=UPI0028821EC0|nr:LacI family DNA-binding transcriptional regulator [Microbacterium sp. ARD32]MDT0158084.1 LacI family DNA-binding transcriptional regulator [Microbacterium sp. ARD32]
MPLPRRVTLARVAEEAGVSVSTASRALRGRGDMSADTRARVLRASAALGYTFAGESRGRPRDSAAGVIDLVFGHFHDPYTDEVVAGARTAAAVLRHDLVLTTDRSDAEDDWPHRIRTRGSAGVIVGLMTPTTAQLALMREAGIRLVLLDPPSEAHAPLPSIRTTDRVGGAAAADHLIDCGARRFILIGGTPSYRFGRARVDGFTSAVRRRAPDARVLRVDGDWGAAAAARAAARALRDLDGHGPIGLFACNDEMAAGAYRAIADAGLEVPRDVLVVGFDDVRGARWLHPPLTTIRQPLREMGAAAVRMLVRGIEGKEPAAQGVELPTALVVRGSTAHRTGAPASSHQPARTLEG